MNKFAAEQVKRSAERVKACVLGKVSADIAARLPEKPEPLDNWDKYKLILAGKAAIKKDMRRKEFFSKYDSKSPDLVSSYTYPVSKEQKAYDAAVKAVGQEQADRELAVELAFNRAADERIMEQLTTAEFLDRLDKMSQQDW